jgi:4-amino-4-deoxy-L-arabinose transferase-like glycosyltransferase
MTTPTLPRSSVDRPAPLCPADAPASRLPRPPRLRRLRRGHPGDPGWARPALIGLLGMTAVLYLWGLGASGWANSFYSAAVQAGTKSWSAFFFGSSDAANAITIDKPPAALWMMELSARVFGLNTWSILVPEALAGVAAVGVLYATVRRWFGSGAALLAGAVLALTPVAALMFRFNDPDALLVLLLTAAAYATVRAIEGGRTRWLLLAGTLVGFGFLTKMLQAFLVVPAFALAYLIAAPTSWRRRLLQLTLAGAAMLASSLWWVVAVQLVPAANRPYIGGSQDNSLWNLIFGYNGFGRLTGNESGSVGGGAVAGSRWGATGWLRMFNSEFGGQAAWLIPAAGILLVACLALTWRARRTDRTRAALVLWGGWLVVTAAVFSFGQGIIHPYYTVALAPAIGALVGIGAATLWQRRAQVTTRAVLAAALVVTAVWSYLLLGRVPRWNPWLRSGELVMGLALAAFLVVWSRLGGRLAAVVGIAAVTVALAAPAAYTLSTVSTPHGGAIPSAGPAGTSRFGPPGLPMAGGALGRLPGGQALVARGAFAGLPPLAGGGLGAMAPPRPAPSGSFTPGRANAAGLGGLLQASQPSAALAAALEQNSSHYRWVAAAIGSNEASGYQLATGKPVMAIGGFNGTDPSPTLVQFERYVQQGKIHYFIASGAGPGMVATSSTSSQISAWVHSHFSSHTVSGVTLYDLTAPLATS